MAKYNLPNTTDGIDTIFTTVATEVNTFIPMFLLFVFCVVLIGGMVRQKRRIGNSDLPMWVTLASLTTLLVALPMTIAVGLIQVEYIAILVTITILSGFWLFLDRKNTEI